MKPLSALIALVLALLLSAGSASAAALIIDDRSVEGQITFYVNDFEGGFSVNGVPIQIGTGNPVAVPYPEGDINHNPITFSFSGVWIDLGQTPTQSLTVVFLEDAETVSDILTYSFFTDGSSGHLSGTFVSDVEGGPPIPFPNPPFITVDNETYFFSAPYLGAEVYSDADAIPEPATWGFLAAGLAVLGLVRRRK